MMRFALFLFTLCWLMGAHAEEAAEIDPRVRLQTTEPDRDVGFTVGDKLTRAIRLEVDQPYQLLPTSLPVAGNQKKRRNQEQGIELSAITLEQSTQANKNVYVLQLTYQIFTNKQVAKPAALPPEFVKFGGKGENFEVRIPSWSFRISPLAVFGAVNVEKDMSAYRGPLLLDATPHRHALWALLGVAGLALLGLFYVLGTATWLPRLGRPFARAGRDLNRLPATPEGLAQAVARLHQAINATAGASIFDADGFIARKPRFAHLRAELEQFFALSRTVFFEPGNGTPHDTPHGWLKQFCRHCRHCERGLK